MKGERRLPLFEVGGAQHVLVGSLLLCSEEDAFDLQHGASSPQKQHEGGGRCGGRHKGWS